MNIFSSQLPDRCLSSHLLSHLLLWRNGPEADGEAVQNLYTELPAPRDPDEDEGGEGKYPIQAVSAASIMATVVVEIPIAIVVITSAIETVAYTIFTSATFFVSFVNEKPYEASKRLLDSSFFTVQWSVGNLIWNLVADRLLTHESLERLQRKHPRPEDRIYIDTYFKGLMRIENAE